MRINLLQPRVVKGGDDLTDPVEAAPALLALADECNLGGLASIAADFCVAHHDEARTRFFRPALLVTDVWDRPWCCHSHACCRPITRRLENLVKFYRMYLLLSLYANGEPLLPSFPQRRSRTKGPCSAGRFYGRGAENGLVVDFSIMRFWRYRMTLPSLLRLRKPRMLCKEDSDHARLRLKMLVTLPTVVLFAYMHSLSSVHDPPRVPGFLWY